MCTSERKERKEIEQDFSQPWEQSDLVLLVEGQRLHVHRLILSMSSPVFKKMFYEDLKEKTEQEIPLPDKKFLEVREMLLMIYPTTQKSVNESNCYFLLALAHEYQISTVIDKCERCLLEALKSKQGSDILDMLFVAQKHSFENVLDECIKKTETLSFEEMTQHPKYKQIEPLFQRKMIELQWRNVVQENHRLKELANEAVGKWESIVFMVGNHIISGTDKVNFTVGDALRSVKEDDRNPLNSWSMAYEPLRILGNNLCEIVGRPERYELIE